MTRVWWNYFCKLVLVSLLSSEFNFSIPVMTCSWITNFLLHLFPSRFTKFHCHQTLIIYKFYNFIHIWHILVDIRTVGDGEADNDDDDDIDNIAADGNVIVGVDRRDDSTTVESSPSVNEGEGATDGMEIDQNMDCSVII